MSRGKEDANSLLIEALVTEWKLPLISSNYHLMKTRRLTFEPQGLISYYLVPGILDGWKFGDDIESQMVRVCSFWVTLPVS